MCFSIRSNLFLSSSSIFHSCLHCSGILPSPVDSLSHLWYCLWHASLDSPPFCARKDDLFPYIFWSSYRSCLNNVQGPAKAVGDLADASKGECASVNPLLKSLIWLQIM